MIAYREDSRTVRTRDELHRLAAARDALTRAPRDQDAALAYLISIGELEAAIGDAIFVDGDRLDDRAAALREMTLDAAALYLDTSAVAACVPEPDRQASAFDALCSLELPEQVSIRTSEGYAYYSLFPETYAESARRFLRETAPQRVCVIGIRSIGTSLSAIVAAALSDVPHVRAFTVRPGGHPFDRQLTVDPTLERAWATEIDRQSMFAVVDEGPGLSGSSFAAVAAALTRLGAATDRIVLFPSWDPDPAHLRSAAAREIWSRLRRYTSDAQAAGISPERIFAVEEPTVDWSAGRWRAHLVAGPECWPAAHPQHERWKACVPGEGRVLKFCGLGRYGMAAFERASRLAAAGLIAAPRALRHGFIDLPFISGAIATAPFTTGEAEHVGRYIGRTAAEFGFQPAGDVSPLMELVRTNIRELPGLGTDLPPAALERLTRDTALAPVSEIDGRLLPHEWIRTTRGLQKVDALEHGRDHFFPGPQSPCWDLAAATLELELDAAGTRRMLDAYGRASGDGAAADRLTSYQLAYAAFRAGYAALAAESLAGTTEAARFTAVMARHRDTLRRLIPNAL